MTAPEEACRGLVVRSEGGFYTVETGADRLLCTLMKRLRRGDRTATNPLAVGDRVLARDLGDHKGVIEQIEPRHNELARTAPGRDGLKHVLVANLDQLLVVSSLHAPDPSAGGLDRLLVIAEQAEVSALIVVTKADLGTGAQVESEFGALDRAGYPVLVTSARTAEGIEALRARLTNRISALVGPSGVGKSTLLNAVQPGLQLRAGELSERTGKGRHTTTSAELLLLSDGGYVADTPGLRGIEPHELDPQLLDTYFPELRPYIGKCRFNPCSHLHEPGCAVRAALDAGRIADSRYHSYGKLFAEARENMRPAWAR